MKYSRIHLIVGLIVAIATLNSRVAAQEPLPTPAAKEAYQKARVLPYGDKSQIALYRKAIDIDPDYYEAHESYIISYQHVSQTGTEEEKNSTKLKLNAELQTLYEQWAKAYPDKAIYEWALGLLNEYRAPDDSVRHFEKAVKIDPKFGPAFDMLAISAEERGDLTLSRTYARQAHECWPENISIWRHYLSTYTVTTDTADLETAKGIAIQMAQKYRDDGLYMLSYIASRSTDEKQRRDIYEILKTEIVNSTSGGYTLVPLFNMELRTDLVRARKLAKELAVLPDRGSATGSTSGSEIWTPILAYADALLTAKQMIGEAKGDQALIMLHAIKAPARGVIDPSTYNVMEAEALSISGQQEKAYTGLVKIYAATPSEDVRDALLDMAKAMGKSMQQVDNDDAVQRRLDSKPGIPFTLKSYATGKPVSLGDYSGRVVLVNFWYPECGPCRAEFPYIQKALEKYKQQGFAVLAINGHPPEDDWVMPLINGWKLGFVPLKSTEEVLKNYKINVFPVNFLYGADGKTYPMPRQVTATTLHQLELQIQGLLSRADMAKTVGESHALEGNSQR